MYYEKIKESIINAFGVGNDYRHDDASIRGGRRIEVRRRFKKLEGDLTGLLQDNKPDNTVLVIHKLQADSYNVGENGITHKWW